MRNFINTNKFLKISTANGFVSVVKTGVSLLANKVVAFYIGTSGIAMIGQLTNFMTLALLFSSGGISQGVTKFVSQYKDNSIIRNQFIATSLILTAALSFFFGFLIIVFSGLLSESVLNSDKYVSVVVVFGVTVLFYNINNLIISILNGFQDYRRYLNINLISAIVSAFFTIILVFYFELKGALFAVVTSQSVVAMFTLWFIKRDDWVLSLRMNSIKLSVIKRLFAYTLFAILGAAMWPLAKIILRSRLINIVSLEEAGLWESVLRLNDYIVNLAIGSFSVYLLPRLAEIKDRALLVKEIISVYKVIIPLSFIGFTFMYLVRDQVFSLLYTRDFLKAGDYLLLQMLGSFFWMCKIVPTNLLLAKGKTILILILEIIFGLLYFVVAYLFIPFFGVQGVQFSFALYNFAYLVVGLLIMRKMVLT